MMPAEHALSIIQSIQTGERAGVYEVWAGDEALIESCLLCIKGRDYLRSPLDFELEALWVRLQGQSRRTGISISIEFPRAAFRLERQGQVKQRPPSAGWIILSLVVPKDLLDHVAGDLEEGFARYCQERGAWAAGVWYWRQVLGSAAPFAIRSLQRAIRLADIWRKISGS